jgi:hypothetical protein
LLDEVWGEGLWLLLERRQELSDVESKKRAYGGTVLE